MFLFILSPKLKNCVCAKTEFFAIFLALYLSKQNMCHFKKNDYYPVIIYKKSEMLLYMGCK